MSDFKERNEHFARAMTDAQVSYIEAERAACDLEAENAKLREERDHWHVEQVHAFGNWEDSHKRAVELEAENAKLRELVRAFDWCTENFDTPNKCDRCLLPQSDALEPECEVRMRELGIEVD